MDPIESSETFEQDVEMQVTEQPDGSALVETPVDAAPPVNFYSNRAEELDQFELNSLASDLLELIEKDKEARKRRDEQYEDGLRRTGLGDDAPGGAEFSGASRVVHPVLAESCVDFAARAIKEIFPAKGPVKTKIHGEATEPKLLKAKAKRDYLNWYISSKMEEYKAEKEEELTQLPLGGSQYEKYWFDAELGRCRMEFVPVDKVFLPYSATSFYTSARITHEQDITRATFEDRIASGLYRDIGAIIDEDTPEATAAQKANDKIEGKDDDAYNDDGLRRVFEVSCRWKFEGDEKAFPHVIHIDESTSKVLGIFRNWNEQDPKAVKLDWWVESKFIPWRGAYGIGLPHLIGTLSGALTGALRALLDSAHINNSPGAVKLKAGRASGQNINIAQTEVKELDAPAGVDDIRKVIMPMPFNAPSPVLFQLLDWLTNQARGVVATAEDKIADASNNMPVGTALALIEQGSQVFSAIHSRLHDSQRRGLKIICRLITSFPEQHAAEMQRFGVQPQDFLDTDDIEPVSDPNIFSESQRYAQMQAVLQLAAGDAQDPSIQWNKIEVRRRMLELLRVDGVDVLLPKPPEPVTADPITENVLSMQGKVLKAGPQQDHASHIRAHLAFIVSPFVAMDPTPNAALGALYNHAREHLLLLYQQSATQGIQQIQQQQMLAQQQQQMLMQQQLPMEAMP